RPSAVLPRLRRGRNPERISPPRPQGVGEGTAGRRPTGRGQCRTRPRAFRARRWTGQNSGRSFPLAQAGTLRDSRLRSPRPWEEGRRRMLELRNVEVVYSDVILVLRGVSLQ